ncbi:MAG: response regulator transcription factor [Candidatus Melainabacteria bacterium]|nr:response regulator transcription factor [Candidatus Melainabacteria bacterium]
MPKVLIVEDDLIISSTLAEWLTLEHYTVEIAQDGVSALEKLRFHDYDLIILDVGLPSMSGLEVCREFRSFGGLTPVLMLTGRRDVPEKVQGFSVGADDYLTKPFDLRELFCRIRALLRRPAGYAGDVLRAADVLLDPTAHRLTRAGREIKLEPLEFALLEFLMRHKGQVFNSEALLRHVWPSDSAATTETVRTYISTLRKKVDPGSRHPIICTVFGLGYQVKTD